MSDNEFTPEEDALIAQIEAVIAKGKEVAPDLTNDHFATLTVEVNGADLAALTDGISVLPAIGVEVPEAIRLAYLRALLVLAEAALASATE